MTTIDPASRWPNYTEADYVIKDYVFASGEVLPELRLHYRTMGVPRRDAAGKIVNGVLLLQGNTGTGANWLRPSLADELYGPGQPLDATQYFLIMQDAIGRGGSSKPSDGLKGKFPHYRYRDMVDSGYRFITEGLGVGHLRLVIGSSMGGMHAWMWAEMYPDLMDGVIALSCQPVEISGRNWLGPPRRRRGDPPRPGLEQRRLRPRTRAITSTAPPGISRTESPTRIQEMAPTLAAANALYERRLAEAAKGDANNQLWAIEAIQDYDPEPDLDKIKAKVLLINDAEDHANPPELGTVERAMKRVKNGRYVLIPAGPDTHGHFSHYYAKLWKPYLIEFLADARRGRRPRRRNDREPTAFTTSDGLSASPITSTTSPIRGGGADTVLLLHAAMGSSTALLRLGAISGARLAGRAARSARPRRLAGAAGRAAAAARTARGRCRRTARPSRSRQRACRRQLGRRLSRPATGDDKAGAGPQPVAVRLDAGPQAEPGAELDPADPGEGAARISRRDDPRPPAARRRSRSRRMVSRRGGEERPGLYRQVRAADGELRLERRGRRRSAVRPWS